MCVVDAKDRCPVPSYKALDLDKSSGRMPRAAVPRLHVHAHVQDPYKAPVMHNSLC